MDTYQLIADHRAQRALRTAQQAELNRQAAQLSAQSRLALARSRQLLQRTQLHGLFQQQPAAGQQHREFDSWHAEPMSNPTGKHRGTLAYSETAEALAKQYESMEFEDVHGDVLELLPQPPARALDIGAGTGRDAAALAARGYRVTAVEPTDEFRAIGESLHENAAIAWIDDALPELTNVSGSFDLILLSGVWMHLDQTERARAMARVAQLLRGEGLMVVSLRRGPIPPGRIMFHVPVEETIAQAQANGLRLVFSSAREGRLNQPGVWWSRLAFRRPT